MYRFKGFLCAAVFATVALPANAQTIIKVATLAPDGTAWMREMRAGAAEVKKRTEGRVEIKYYPGGVMGDAPAVMRKIKIGQLHGGAFTSTDLSPIVKDAPIYSLPFIFRNENEITQVRAKLDPMLKQSFQKAGFEVLGSTGGGFAYLMSVRNIKNDSDLKNAKVWVPQGDTISEVAFKAVGVTPVSLSLADVYTSLQTGLIDTAANTEAGAIAFQWHTKLKHMIDLPLTYVVGLLVVDKKIYDALTVEDQKILSAELNAAFTQLEKINRDDNTAAREALKQQGITISEPNMEERKKWEAVGTTAYKQLVSENTFTPELVKTLEAVLAEVRGGAGK